MRQGCPLFPYLLVLGAAARKDENNRGINFANVECKHSQYANDTMILDGSELSFCRTLYLLDTFAISSGLKINHKKTDVLWIGVCKDRDFLIPLTKPINWANSKVCAPGVHFATLDINESNIIFVRTMKRTAISCIGRFYRLFAP